MRRVAGAYRREPLARVHTGRRSGGTGGGPAAEGCTPCEGPVPVTVEIEPDSGRTVTRASVRVICDSNHRRSVICDLEGPVLRG